MQLRGSGALGVNIPVHVDVAGGGVALANAGQQAVQFYPLQTSGQSHFDLWFPHVHRHPCVQLSLVQHAPKVFQLGYAIDHPNQYLGIANGLPGADQGARADFQPQVQIFQWPNGKRQGRRPGRNRVRSRLLGVAARRLIAGFGIGGLDAVQIERIATEIQIDLGTAAGAVNQVPVYPAAR